MPERKLWNYDTALTSPILAPYCLSRRQLQRLVSSGEPHQKIGHAVRFTDDDLRGIAASFQR